MTSDIAAIRRELEGIQAWFRANATTVQRDPEVRAAWDQQLARKTSLEIDLALARRRMDNAATRQVPDPRSWHGTVTGYATRKCRCDECSSAMRAYGQSKRAGTYKPRFVPVPMDALKRALATEPTMRAIANTTGIDERTIGRWANGKHTKTRASAAKALADAYPAEAT